MIKHVKRGIKPLWGGSLFGGDTLCGPQGSFLALCLGITPGELGVPSAVLGRDGEHCEPCASTRSNRPFSKAPGRHACVLAQGGGLGSFWKESSSSSPRDWHSHTGALWVHLAPASPGPACARLRPALPLDA